jgi:hypothetical protein
MKMCISPPPPMVLPQVDDPYVVSLKKRTTYILEAATSILFEVKSLLRTKPCLSWAVYTMQTQSYAQENEFPPFNLVEDPLKLLLHWDCL